MLQPFSKTKSAFLPQTPINDFRIFNGSWDGTLKLWSVDNETKLMKNPQTLN